MKSTTSNDFATMTHPFNDEELLIIFEAARLALTNSFMCDELADIMDLSDETVFALSDNLQKFMRGTQRTKQ